MLQTKSSAFFSLLLVFVSGGVVGTLVDRLYVSTSTVASANKQAQQRPDPEEARKGIVNEMTTKVKLDPQQVQEYQQILDGVREQWMAMAHRQDAEGQALRDTQVERVRKILRPDQIPLYDALRAEKEVERAKHEAEHKAQRHKGPAPDQTKTH